VYFSFPLVSDFIAIVSPLLIRSCWADQARSGLVSQIGTPKRLIPSVALLYKSLRSVVRLALLEESPRRLWSTKVVF
jgi:hypothetical protein